MSRIKFISGHFFHFKLELRKRIFESFSWLERKWGWTLKRDFSSKFQTFRPNLTFSVFEIFSETSDNFLLFFGIGRKFGEKKIVFQVTSWSSPSSPLWWSRWCPLMTSSSCFWTKFQMKTSIFFHRMAKNVSKLWHRRGKTWTVLFRFWIWETIFDPAWQRTTWPDPHTPLPASRRSETST